ncbi:hypothetical protein Rcae01_01141 [Novipirellula caenicola]|uniref:Uncharacterized protein n=1 Tax=Novipirellula caenicola TaxID=1536901 RepID=A0ABP9VKI2_9BACT
MVTGCDNTLGRRGTPFLSLPAFMVPRDQKGCGYAAVANLLRPLNASFATLAFRSERPWTMDRRSLLTSPCPHWRGGWRRVDTALVG